MKSGLDTEAIRKDVVNKTGMAPAFYLHGTKMIVSHAVDLDFLKRINDREGIISIKGSKFSAGVLATFRCIEENDLVLMANSYWIE